MLPGSDLEAYTNNALAPGQKRSQTYTNTMIFGLSQKSCWGDCYYTLASPNHHRQLTSGPEGPFERQPTATGSLSLFLGKLSDDTEYN